MSTPTENRKRKSNPLDDACIELSELEAEEIINGEEKKKKKEEEEEEEEEDIETQFNNWKINSSLLYDFVCRKELEWPSLSIEFGDVIEKDNDDTNMINQIVCVGTHTSNNEPNFLYVCEVIFPADSLPQETCIYKVNDTYEGFDFITSEKKKFNIKSKIAHAGEVNRIKFLPSDKRNLAITKAKDGNLHLFDINKHQIETVNDKMCPESSFIGNNSDGFGIDFNVDKKYIYTCGNDGSIVAYDYKVLNTKNVNPFYQIKYKASINDIAATNDENILLACSDNGYILAYDIRLKTLEPVQQVLGQQVPVNTISINKHTGKFASGSDNGKIKIWDLKHLKEPLHIINAHKESIIRLNFSPTDSSLLASAGNTRFIHLYDLNKIGEEIDAVDLPDGPSELIFSHGGHTQAVTDFNWNHFKKLKMLIGSTSEDNTLQLWRLKPALLEDTETLTTTTTNTDVE